MHPQAWKVEAGHVLKLELLTADSTYLRNSSSPHSVQVRNLELRVPTIDPPGSAEGMVQTPQPHYLPPGYTLARNVVPAAPTAPMLSSGSNPNNSGQFTLTWEATQAADPADLHAPAQERLRRLEHRGQRAHRARPTPSPPATPRVKAPGTTASRRATKAPKANRRVNPKRSRSTRPRPTHPRRAPTGRPTTRVAAAGTRTRVEVSFASGGDPNLSDGSAGSGVDPTSIPAAADVQHQRLARSVRHREGQSRQRILARLPDGAGRRHARRRWN